MWIFSPRQGQPFGSSVWLALPLPNSFWTRQTIRAYAEPVKRFSAHHKLYFVIWVVSDCADAYSIAPNGKRVHYNRRGCEDHEAEPQMGAGHHFAGTIEGREDRQRLHGEAFRRDRVPAPVPGPTLAAQKFTLCQESNDGARNKDGLALGGSRWRGRCTRFVSLRTLIACRPRGLQVKVRQEENYALKGQKRQQEFERFDWNVKCLVRRFFLTFIRGRSTTVFRTWWRRWRVLLARSRNVTGIS